MKIRQWLNSFRRRKLSPPLIMTEHGAVTESARLQAAMNMRADHELRERVVRLIQSQTGLPLARAMEETVRRYPEAFED